LDFIQASPRKLTYCFPGSIMAISNRYASLATVQTAFRFAESVERSPHFDAETAARQVYTTRSMSSVLLSSQQICGHV
jgi:hypothetical protein